jgi:hypothetical protein
MLGTGQKDMTSKLQGAMELYEKAAQAYKGINPEHWATRQREKVYDFGHPSITGFKSRAGMYSIGIVNNIAGKIIAGRGNANSLIDTYNVWVGNLYKALLSPKSRKFDLRIQPIVPEPTLESNM